MSAISASLVKDLREKTGAGMGDCKRALEEAGGDMQGAIEWLRKRGAASVAKRADREANEGLVVSRTSADGKTAALVEVTCETDFVARNEEFVNFANTIADAVLARPIASEDDLWNTKLDGDKTLGNLRDEMLAKFSEKIGLSRYERITTNGFITDYIHAGNRLGVLVEFDAAPAADAKPLTRDVAMQVAAMQPMFVNRSQVDQTTLAKELEIYKSAAIEEGKKEEIAERVAQGKLGKFYEEQVLIEQTFVKDSSKKVSDVVAEISKMSGGTVNVVTFVRFNIGEK